MRFYIGGKKSKACITDENGMVLEFIETNEDKTNNQMEYKALLITLLNYANKGDEILTDSQLIVGHLIKNWKIKAEHLKLIVEECKKLVEMKEIKISWIPRNENKAGIILNINEEKLV